VILPTHSPTTPLPLEPFLTNEEAVALRSLLVKVIRNDNDWRILVHDTELPKERLHMDGKMEARVLGLLELLEAEKPDAWRRVLEFCCYRFPRLRENGLITRLVARACMACTADTTGSENPVGTSDAANLARTAATLHRHMPDLWSSHLDATRAAHSHIKLYGIRQQGRAARIELQEVYVELSAVRSDHREVGQADELSSLEAFSAKAGAVHADSVVAGAVHADSVMTAAVRRSPGPGLSDRGMRLHEALARSPRAIVIGNPGSGKTTLLRYVARIVSEAWLEPTRAPRARQLLGLPDEAPLPVPIFTTLDALDRYLAGLNVPTKQLRSEHVLGFLLDLLWTSTLKIGKAELKATLDAGRVLLLLDGLDEIPSHRDRKRAVLGVARLLDRFGKGRTVLTSRTRAFQDDLRGEL